MHEFGLIASMIEVVDESARSAGATEVVSIGLAVGELTQAVDEALRFAFDALSPGTICEGAELDVRFVPPRSRCLDCGLEFDHDAYHRVCPRCDSPATTVIAGRELLVEAIEVELPD